MMINPLSTSAYTPPSNNSSTDLSKLNQAGEAVKQSKGESSDEVKETFTSVFGEMLYFEMLKGMRKTLDKPAYFHGGAAEEMFTQQLDQVISQKMAETSGDALLGQTFEASQR